ncbi:hypothetical protein PTSG_05426 [Salpingoeca rosetta]|uniref:Aldehyde dehydrogenase domain-containing protein n=1 Tax=Salpingoeca rosetta (strain ATCC 50818 / BSB-021) TaxID=946362 RepID=F2UAE5_SALR5|nr:uncharacterized protein PTSG_05426 [Salpingoeca rosetta]EGD73720.1 hypothetical protein PTSG_05426 [Salpingoeca rosetta]|eukprot:XP_004994001.1 hypothetical protein PTSG_05426 [Salpingoeca rosetta]
MVSSVSHVLRGQFDPWTLSLAGSFTFVWLSLYSRRPSFLAFATLGFVPLLLIPDYSVTECLEGTVVGNVLSQVPATYGAAALFLLVTGASCLLMRKPKRKDDDYIVDESCFADFKLVGKVNREYTLDEIPTLVQEMQRSYASGITRPVSKRKEQLRQLRKFFVENEERIIAAVHEDLKRPRFETIYYDVALPIAEIDDALHKLDQWMEPEPVGPHILSFPSTQWTQPEPYGVALVIGTWNFPFQLELVPALGAIAAGNTVIIKPCNTSKACARLLADVLPKYMDPRVVQVVGANFKGDRECTAKLLEEKTDIIFFTGSPTVGRVIMQGAAQHLTPCVLELGGKNPVYVDKSADIDLAAKRCVWARNFNCGQQCIAPDFVLCHKDVIEQFKERCRHYCQVMYENNEDDPNIGRVVGDKQMDRLVGLLNSHGGQVVAGGQFDRKKRYIAATVIHVSRTSTLMQDETFGPILAVTEAESVEDAIAEINSRPKPLALYIFAQDEAVQRRVVENTSSGGVTVNSCLFHVGHPGLPFGGIGNSGMGAYHGENSHETIVCLCLLLRF